MIEGFEICVRFSINLSIYLIYIAPLHRFYILSETLVQGISVFHSFVRRSHLLPDQLPGEHTGDTQLYPHFYFSTTTRGNAQCFCIRFEGTISNLKT